MIAIVVDHPKRDLPSIVKLSEYLIEKLKMDVILVPFYNLDNFLLSKLFKSYTKLILFNYFRLNISEKIKFSYNSGKITVIYDTEGAPGPNGLWLEKSFKSMVNYMKYIDHYLFWGNAQRENIKKNFDLPFETSVVGYLRFNENIKNSNFKNNILINSNFAFANPKFNSSFSEIKDLKKLGFANDKESEQKYYETFQRKLKFLEAIKELIKSFPSKTFTIRPHPFEKEDDYLKLTQNYKNVKMDKFNTSIKALSNSSAMVHIDCTTAIEANYLNIPVLCLSWLKNQGNIFAIASDIGYQAKNSEDAKYFLKNPVYTNKKHITKNISDFFGDNKKNTLIEIENIFKNLIQKCENKQKKQILFLSFKSYIKVFLQAVLPDFLYSSLLKYYRGENVKYRKYKSFSVNDITNELSKKIYINNIRGKYYILTNEKK